MRDDNVQLVTEILDSLNELPEKDPAAAELVSILQEPHFQVQFGLIPLLHNVSVFQKGLNRSQLCGMNFFLLVWEWMSELFTPAIA